MSTTPSGSERLKRPTPSPSVPAKIVGASDSPALVFINSVEPIIGMRIALRPIARKPDGSTYLMREIAAKVLDIPDDLDYLQVIRTRVGGLWSSGERVEWNGPTFDMVNGSDD